MTSISSGAKGWGAQAGAAKIAKSAQPTAPALEQEPKTFTRLSVSPDPASVNSRDSSEPWRAYELPFSGRVRKFSSAWPAADTKGDDEEIGVGRRLLGIRGLR